MPPHTLLLERCHIIITGYAGYMLATHIMAFHAGLLACQLRYAIIAAIVVVGWLRQLSLAGCVDYAAFIAIVIAAAVVALVVFFIDIIFAAVADIVHYASHYASLPLLPLSLLVIITPLSFFTLLRHYAYVITATLIGYAYYVYHYYAITRILSLRYASILSFFLLLRADHYIHTLRFSLLTIIIHYSSLH